MIFVGRKYLCLYRLRTLAGIWLWLLVCSPAYGQVATIAKDSNNTSATLRYYHSFAPAKAVHPFQHVDYTRPNNQLMSWPNFPLTPTEMERRHRQYLQENKPAAIIARDIITGLLKKKPVVAVIPKF